MVPECEFKVDFGAQQGTEVSSLEGFLLHGCAGGWAPGDVTVLSTRNSRGHKAMPILQVQDGFVDGQVCGH